MTKNLNLNNAVFVTSAASEKQFISSSVKGIAFAGKSNVGKSSVINSLLNRKNLAKTGAQPGKTVHVNYFLIDDRVYFIDLPGYGYAKVSKVEKLRWAELVEGYFAAGRNIALVVQIIDMRHKPSADDMNMINYLYDSGIPFIIVMTKADKLNNGEYAAQLEQMSKLFADYEGVGLYPFSALSGDGAQAITDAIQAYLSA